MNHARTTERSAFISRACVSLGITTRRTLARLAFPLSQLFAQPSLQPPPEMVGAWVSTYCLNVEGFPKILHATMQKLGVKDRPEYEEHGTDRCEVTIYIGKSEDFPNLTEAWSVTATGFSFIDTYQVVACKALWYLYQIYVEPIAVPP